MAKGVHVEGGGISGTTMPSDIKFPFKVLLRARDCFSARIGVLYSRKSPIKKERKYF